MKCQMILKLIQFQDLHMEYIRLGNYAIRMMKWMNRDIYIENINYFDLIGTALTHMKGRNLYVTKELFALINDRCNN